MKLLGAPIAKQIKEELIARPKPSGRLAIVQVGNDPVSSIYVKKKEEFAKDVGVETLVVKSTPDRIEAELDRLSQDLSVKAIIVQLPLPEGINRNDLLNLIPKEKDVDGFRYILDEDFVTYPPTVLAIDEIIKFYNLPVEKGVLIVGGGFLVGKPLEKYLKSNSVHAEILEKNDTNYKEKLRSYDIVVVATGGGRTFDQGDFKPGAYVIDASTIADENKVRGDFVGASDLINLAGVPGGVGPITVAQLFRNFFFLTIH